MNITNQEVLRPVQLKKACLLADIRKTKMGFWPYHQAQHTPTCFIRSETRRQAQPCQTKNHVDGEYNKYSRFGYVEATIKSQDMNNWRQLIGSDPVMDGT